MVLLLIVVVAEPQVLLFLIFSLYTVSGVVEKPVVALYHRLYDRITGKPRAEKKKTSKNTFEDLEDREIFFK